MLLSSCGAGWRPGCPLFAAAAFDELGGHAGVVLVVTHLVEVERILPRDVVGPASSLFGVTVPERLSALTCDSVPTEAHAADTGANLWQPG
jgi:hypothetical protein